MYKAKINDLRPWFTLVELIVVIVILAILATIAFLSFSSQSASARDSTRLSDMSNITKWLMVFNATSGIYPPPDWAILITASWTAIWKQWYAWANILNMLKVSNGWKDPLDTSTYYTYSTNQAQSKFQILGFLEDGSNSALSLVPFAWNTASADPSSYSWRYLITRWDQLWILLNSTTLVPAQTLNVSIDVVLTTWSYVAQFTNKDKVTWTGSALFVVNGTMKTWWSKFPGCDNYDIAIWNQVWASCNSTIWEWSEWWYTSTWATWSVGAGDWCWDYAWVLNVTNCVIWSVAMESNSKEKSWATAAWVNWTVDGIWWKFYNWKQASLKNNACANWWHLPSDNEWTTLENYLKGSTCAWPAFMRDWVNATWNWWWCSGLGWINNSSKNASNNLIQALKLPLSWRVSSNGLVFSYRGYYTSLWTNTANSSTGIFNRYIYFNMDSVNRAIMSSTAGASVRCIKD